MDRWSGKVAVVTGASAGIGAATVESLVKHGMKVVGLARRLDRIEELQKKLKGQKGQLFPLKGDVSKPEEVEAAFKWIEDKFSVIHVLVNNAGIVRPGKIIDSKFEHLQDIINTNLVGMVQCTQKALKLMKKAGVDDGHIININSIAGHSVIKTPVPVMNVYGASKFGMTAFTEALRQELADEKSKIRVTSISPGAVATEISDAAIAATGAELPSSSEFKDLIDKVPILKSEDIADSVIYVLGAPAHVGITESISPGGVATESLDAVNVAAGSSLSISSEFKELIENAPILKPEDISDSIIYVLSAPAHVGIHELTIRPVGDRF